MVRPLRVLSPQSQFPMGTFSEPSRCLEYAPVGANYPQTRRICSSTRLRFQIPETQARLAKFFDSVSPDTE